MEYKLSKYNVIFERSGSDYLWNTLTGTLIKLDEKGKEYVQPFNSQNTESPYFSILKNAGCIVDSRYNEIGKILTDEKSAMLNPTPRSVHFTIAPGLGCNYKCPYCFEKERSSHSGMTKETQDEVCKYILDIAENNPVLNYIGITWFGGEPLLYTETIEYISSKLMEYCEERNIGYGAGIVTNGRFLTADTAKMLVKNKVSYVQLAIDGMRDYYSVQKGTVPEDFDATVANVVATAEIIPITVRINISDDLSEALALTEYLLSENNLDGKIKIYVAHIRDYKEKCMSLEEKSHEHFLSLEKQYMDLFKDDGPYSKNSMFYTVPERRSTTCLSVCGNNFCIGPEGELYRCEHFFGNPDYVVGTIREGRFYSESEIEYLLHQHPKQCLSCEMFPVCLGGCMNDNKGGDVALACEVFKERMKDYIVM